MSAAISRAAVSKVCQRASDGFYGVGEAAGFGLLK